MPGLVARATAFFLRPRIALGFALLVRDFVEVSGAYFNSTFAPAFSSWALTFSASSFGIPSFTAFGAPSTRSLASFSPRPVSARTSLMTSIFFSPAAVSMTVNSVFSSTGAAAAAAGPATATAAAAETPHFSSRSFASSAASSTVRLESSSTILLRSAISHHPLFGSNQWVIRETSRGFALVGISLDHTRELGSRRVRELRDLGRRRHQEADKPCTQFIERRQRGECLDAVGIQGGLAHRSAENDELFVRLGEVGGDLGRRNHIARVSEDRRPLQQGTDGSDVRAFESDLGEAVFRDLHGSASLPHLLAQRLHLGDRETGILGDNDDVGGLEDPVQRRDGRFLFRSIHVGTLFGWRLWAAGCTSRPS